MLSNQNLKLSAEETTFTVFFVALTAVIGRELQKMSSKKNLIMDRTILSTTNFRITDDSDHSSISDDNSSIRSGGKDLLSTFDRVLNSSDDDTEVQVGDSSHRSRFRDSLNASKLEEARSIASAQLDLAFEMLDVMKERNLTASPVAYKCLIDACGRCGDTDRATDLLRRMHDDGIVADGVVYSCLVSAFSTEKSIWGKASGKSDLPGE